MNEFSDVLNQKVFLILVLSAFVSLSAFAGAQCTETSEIHSVPVGGSVTVDVVEFRLEDLNPESAVMFARTSDSAGWNICGSYPSCTVAVGSTKTFNEVDFITASVTYKTTSEAQAPEALASFDFRVVKCGGSEPTVTEPPGSDWIPVISSPADNQNFYVTSVPMTFSVQEPAGQQGNYYCQYALWYGNASAYYEIGQVAGGTPTTVSIAYPPLKFLTAPKAGLPAGLYRVQVRCKESESSAVRPPALPGYLWRSSQIVRFNVLEDGKPVIKQPPNGYTHWGEDVKMKMIFLVEGKSVFYRCGYLLDEDTAVEVGRVDPGKETSVEVLPERGWTIGRHVIQVGCAPAELPFSLSRIPFPPNVKLSDPVNFEVAALDSDTPALLLPVANAYYLSPIEFRFKIEGASHEYECEENIVSGIDTKYQKTVVATSGVEHSESVVLTPWGGYTAFVKCRPNGSSGTFITSNQAFFTLVAPDVPMVVHPENQTTFDLDTVPLAFAIGGTRRYYACGGNLTDVTKKTSSEIEIGLVDTGGPGKLYVRNLLKMTPLQTTNYKITVTCATTVLPISTQGLKKLSLADAPSPGKESTPVFFDVNLGGGPTPTPHVNPPVVYSPQTGDLYASSMVPFQFSVTGSFPQYSCSKTLDSATIELGSVANGVSYADTLSDLASGTHALSVKCTAASNPSYYATSGSTSFTVQSTGGGGGGPSGGGGGGQCSADSDCSTGLFCASNGYCSLCYCRKDNLCNPCCSKPKINVQDPDCTQATPTPTEEPPEEFPEQPEWPETPAGTPTPTPIVTYALSLKCANTPAGTNATITATLTRGGAVACDNNMQATLSAPGGEKKVLTADASNCVSNGTHVFTASGLKSGQYQAIASSLGGSSAQCVFRVLEPTAAAVPWEFALLAIIIVAAIAGGYYYYKKYYKKGGASGIPKPQQ
ncbi:hypothetical protein H0N96_02675 [Candidatus Micrarchaeota archaeon]|nr:hypothetical protein [Candidatus Micrarchaeota archaeon]